jgi:hypothetical protein
VSITAGSIDTLINILEDALSEARAAKTKLDQGDNDKARFYAKGAAHG